MYCRSQTGEQISSSSELAWHGLRDGEQCLVSLPTIENGHWMLWMALAIGVGGSGLFGLLLVVAWLLPASSGLPLSDRLLRLVMLVDHAVFGERRLHITAARLVITQNGKPTWENPLNRIALLDSRTAWTRGNLVIHTAKAPAHKATFWVINSDQVAATIQAACLGERKK